MNHIVRQNEVRTGNPKCVKIRVDLDDTLADVKRAGLQKLNRTFGSTFELEHLRALFHIEDTHEGKKHRITEHHVKEAFRSVWRDGSVSLLDPHAPRVLNDLRDYFGDRISIPLTTATDADDNTVRNWLRAHRIPIIRIERVGHATEKSKMDGHVFVDDDVRVAETVAETERPTFFLVRPWGIDLVERKINGQCSKFIIPVENWVELDRKLRPILDDLIR